MSAKIIRRKPKYRLNSDIKYAEGGKNSFLVEFKGKRRQAWIGQFETDGENGLYKVLTYGDEPFGVVIAGGKGYLVNIEKQEIRGITGDKRRIISAINTSDQKYCVAGTKDNIYVIDKEGNIREIIPDFEVEGFYLEKSNSNTVSGMLESNINMFEKEIPFMVDLEKQILHVDY